MYNNVILIKYKNPRIYILNQNQYIIDVQQTNMFIEAAKNGHVEVLKLLLKRTPDTLDKEKMIHEYNDETFRLAARNSHIKTLELLVKETPDQVKQKEMVGTKNEEILKIQLIHLLYNLYSA